MSEAIEAIGEALDYQRRYVDSWKRPSELLLFETIRVIDKLFFTDLFDVRETPAERRMEAWMASWGVNQALKRVLPQMLGFEPFRLLPSNEDHGSKAYSFLLHGGLLETGELLYEWAREGLISARLDIPKKKLRSRVAKIVVLKTADPSLFRELLSHGSRRWMADLVYGSLQKQEREVEKRHLEMLPEIVKRVDVVDGWRMRYTTTPEIDRHFADWATVYLRRIWGADILGAEDRIGGCQFNEYLGMLVGLAARAQKHLCFASVLKRRHPELDYSNLLTSYGRYDDILVSLADFFDADRLHVQKLLSCLTLGPDNAAVHLERRDTAWAPLVRSSAGFCIHPVYGLDINPYLFLMRDLAAKFPADWSRLANNREARWRAELSDIFLSPSWAVPKRPTVLRDGKTTVTDLDFVAYDTKANELAVFQLKWQQPVGPNADFKDRRNAGTNLVGEGNKWIAAVRAWLEKFGAAELARRAEIAAKPDLRVQLFVLVRYNAHFSGYGHINRNAVWLDWNRLLKALAEHPGMSPVALARTIEEETAASPSESYFVPLGDTVLLLNPKSEPTEIERSAS